MTAIKPITKRIRKKHAAEMIALMQKRWFFQRMRRSPQNRSENNQKTTVEDQSNDTDRNLCTILSFPFRDHTQKYTIHI